MPPTLSLIAAIDEEGAIGRTGGGMPWRVPDESAHFRAFCRGQWLVVGRRTFAEMTGWFESGRRVIVLTRRAAAPAPAPTPHADAVMTAASIAEAQQLAGRGGATRLVVIGGARTYAAALPHARQLVLTRLSFRSHSDILFPPVDWSQWTLDHTDPVRRDTTTGAAFHIEWWTRTGGLPDSGS